MRSATPARRFTAAAVGAAMAATLGLAAAVPAASEPAVNAWFTLDDQLNGRITATVQIGSVLYAGGLFTEAGGEPAEGVATYDGTTWAPLPSGPGFEVDSLATDGTNLYAGGAFYHLGLESDSPGGVAMWDGHTWTDLTSDLPPGSDITALVYGGGGLYAFGFTYVDPQDPNERTCLAMYMNGDFPYSDVSWASVGTFTGHDCQVNDAVLSRSGTWIYVVGDFLNVDTFVANGVARMEIGEGWSGYGNGLDFGEGVGSGYSVVENRRDGDLIVAGDLVDANEERYAVALYDPSDQWVPLLGFTGFNGELGADVAVYDGGFFLGGYFDAVNGVPMNGIARWDSDNAVFNTVGDGVTYADGTIATVMMIAPYGDKLIVSGDFDKAGSVSATDVAYYVPPRPTATATVPGAPRSVKATAGKGSAAVAWSAPLSDGGSPVTGYTVTAAPGGRTCAATAPATTCTVTGLTAGTAYRFTVKATNTVGTGPASAASAAVRPLSAASATYRTITTRVLFFAGDSRVGPKGAAALAALKARVPAGAQVTWVKVTGYVQGTTSRYVASDSALALARAKASAGWLKRHGVGGGYTVGSGGVSGSTGLARAAVVAIRYVVRAA